MSQKRKKDKKAKGPRRQERRFIAQSSYNPWLVRVTGAIGAMLLGAGMWAYLYGHAFDGEEKTKPIPSYLIAAGAIVTGIAIWLGTSSEPPIRVGHPGIAVEKGELRRMPWAGLTELGWDSGSRTLLVTGTDEAGQSWTFKVGASSYPEAVGWILKEALDRVPKVVDIADDVLEGLPGASAHAGLKIDLEPLQVVGKRDALTGKIISYEPDARVCLRCERVYFKDSVPKKCKCGASLANLRGKVEGATDEDDGEESEGADSARKAATVDEDST